MLYIYSPSFLLRTLQSDHGSINDFGRIDRLQCPAFIANVASDFRG